MDVRNPRLEVIPMLKHTHEAVDSCAIHRWSAGHRPVSVMGPDSAGNRPPVMGKPARGRRREVMGSAARKGGPSVMGEPAPTPSPPVMGSAARGDRPSVMGPEVATCRFE